MGEAQLRALRLRCSACGAADCSIVVSGRHQVPF
jgi:translation initiation factor 2 beta subunit (eIF-2beta)/eIF-5